MNKFIVKTEGMDDFIYHTPQYGERGACFAAMAWEAEQSWFRDALVEFDVYVLEECSQKTWKITVAQTVKFKRGSEIVQTIKNPEYNWEGGS